MEPTTRVEHHKYQQRGERYEQGHPKRQQSGSRFRNLPGSDDQLCGVTAADQDRLDMLLHDQPPMCGSPEPHITSISRFSKLPAQDSNLERLDQNQLCCRLHQRGTVCDQRIAATCWLYGMIVVVRAPGTGPSGDPGAAAQPRG